MHSLHEMIYFLLNKPYRYWSNGKWNGCDSVSLSDLDNLLCLLFFLFCFLICHCWFCLFSIQIFYSLLFFISFFLLIFHCWCYLFPIQILEHHIRMVLPGLKAELNSHTTSVVKELRMYGEAIESKVSYAV